MKIGIRTIPPPMPNKPDAKPEAKPTKANAPMRSTIPSIACPRCHLVDRFHETNQIGRMELKPTDLILRRRVAPSRRMAAGSLSLVAVLRDARKSALLRTRLTDASIRFEPRKRSTSHD